MIIKASQRGGASQLATHLLKPENEHVTVHEVRGFVSDDVRGAFKEIQIISAGTRASQPFFSVSLNPPPNENVRVEVFESALSRIEESTGLTGQPRVVIFHEKEGRRHCHAVWSRIDAETMTAKQLSHYKLKMRDISREQFLEHGWKMPRGFMDSKQRDPRNFDLKEWQEAKRAGDHPRLLKTAIHECWAVSDSRASFERALEERGLYLARGERRSHVAVTYGGQVLGIARSIGCKVKDVRGRLGGGDDLRSVEETRAHIADVIAPRLRDLIATEKERHAKNLGPLDARREFMREQHARERQRMEEGQRQREVAENIARNERLRSGLGGLWDRLTGESARQRKRNEMEAHWALMRDREQSHAMMTAQLDERRALQEEIATARLAHADRLRELHRDLSDQRHQQAIQRQPVMQRAQEEEKLRIPAANQAPAAPPTHSSMQAMFNRLAQADHQAQLARLGATQPRSQQPDFPAHPALPHEPAPAPQPSHQVQLDRLTQRNPQGQIDRLGQTQNPQQPPQGPEPGR